MAAADEPLWSASEVASVTGGEWLRPPGPAWAPEQVRSTAMGDILPGWLRASIVFVTTERRLERWFGDEPLPPVEPKGCVVVGRADAASPNLPRHRAVLVVDDTFAALRALAARARERLEGRVLVVTGTVGKTTTRAMLVHLLQVHGRVLTNAGNGNFRAHVLQHMASAPPDVPFVVFEVGLGGPRDVFRDVSAIVRPHVVVLTQLDIAHLDTITRKPLTEHEARLAVADQKLQITESLVEGGTVLVHRDSAVHDHVAARLAGRRVVTFGTASGSDLRLLHAERDGRGTRVRAQAPGALLDYHLPLPGRFMGVNSLGALGAASVVAGDLGDHAAALATVEAVPGRARVLDLEIEGRCFSLIDDSYNATPLSMHSTLELLQEAAPTGEGRRIAVLGDIAHLGASSADVHAALAAEAERRGVDRVYTQGAEALHLQRSLPPRMAAGHFEDRASLLRALVRDLRDGDVVTIKASVPARFDLLVFELRALGELAPTQPGDEPVPLVSASAAARIGAGPLVPRRDPAVPRGSWLYSTDGRGGSSLLAGEDVEELGDGIVEGVWDRPFEEGRPDLAEHLFGSGLVRGEDDRLTVLTPKHTLEGVFVLEHKPSQRTFVSNSLAFALAAADTRAPLMRVLRSLRVTHGFHAFDTLILETEEIALRKLVYYDHALLPDGSARRLPLAEPMRLASYADYRAAASATVAALVTNAGAVERRRSYSPLATVSSGYDSVASAVLAAEAGCREAITVGTAAGGRRDSGRTAAEALGMAVTERERPVFAGTDERTRLRDPAAVDVSAEFLASGMGGDDVLFSGFEDVLPGRLLFTGFHGDKYWDIHAKPSTDAKRGDASGSSLGEYRARLGFAHVAVPFLFIRSQPAIRDIGRSEAMKPWSVGGVYDRPVPRRIAEEAGIPRDAFGRRKMAVAVVFDAVGHVTADALRTMIDRYRPAVGLAAADPLR